jgi:hypothetical protein
MKKKSKIAERLEQMPPEEMQARWHAVRGRYLRMLGLFVSISLILYLANHFQHFEQSILNIVNVAFQISCIFVVLFVFLTAMSLIHGRAPKEVKQTS